MVVRPKDSTEDHRKTGVIYSITCRDCKKEYVGESSRTLATRINEHRTRETAVHEHMSNTGHTIEWNRVKVLETEQIECRRKVKEAINIRQRTPALNRDAGTDLPAIYSCLLSRDHRSCDN